MGVIGICGIRELFWIYRSHREIRNIKLLILDIEYMATKEPSQMKKAFMKAIVINKMNGFHSTHQEFSHIILKPKRLTPMMTSLILTMISIYSILVKQVIQEFMLYQE
jgi:hypothetical protein